MRATSAGAGCGETNSRHSLRVMNSAVAAPAGEGPRHSLHVLHGVMPLAEGEQLHPFARKILVGAPLAVESAVEVAQHRGVARHGMQQRAEIAQRVLAQQHVLAVHHLRRLHFLHARYEMVVPEQRHALAQRIRRGQHLPQPPLAQLDVALDALGLQAGARFGIQRAETSRRKIRRIHPAGGGRHTALHRKQALGGLHAREPGIGLDLGNTRAQSGADEQVAGVVRPQRGCGCHGRPDRQGQCRKRPAQHATRTHAGALQSVQSHQEFHQSPRLSGHQACPFRYDTSAYSSHQADRTARFFVTVCEWEDKKPETGMAR